MGAMASHVAGFWGRLQARGSEPVFYYRGETWTAARLCQETSAATDRLASAGVGPGMVTAFCIDDSPATGAALLAAMRLGAISLLVGRRELPELPRLADIACVERVVDIATGEVSRREVAGRSELLDRFRARAHAGLVVFTSGSAGAPKGILHDVEWVLKKHLDLDRRGFRTLLLMPLHHMGGINTLLGGLCRAGGLIAFADGHGAGNVARLVAEARVELLPATPSFLNLFLAAGPFSHDLSSVKLITYGAEVMPEGLLERVRPVFPNARFRQTYALSELGALPRMESRPDGSLWIRLVDPTFELEVRDGLLHLRSEYAMVGYLNAPSPVDEQGWLNTGDAVTVDGDWIRIRGRASDLINVGGEKVFPAEVEAVLQKADNVLDAACFGEPDPLLGARVVARVVLAKPEDPTALRQRLRAFCLQSLTRYKVPMRFEITEEHLMGDRLKKKRGGT